MWVNVGARDLPKRLFDALGSHITHWQFYQDRMLALSAMIVAGGSRRRICTRIGAGREAWLRSRRSVMINVPDVNVLTRQYADALPETLAR